MRGVINYLEKIVQQEKPPTSGQRAVLFVLRLLSVVYAGVVRVRNFLYSRELLPRYSLPLPVISIGNISAGGTGKTPAVIFLARLLTGKGRKVAVLSRGYKGEKDRTGQTMIVNAGTSPRQAGDEPVLIARRLPGVPVLVGRNRYQSGRLGLKEFGTEVFILDDGFQHLILRRNLDLVLIDAARPFFQPLLPRGYLREPPASLERAGGVILTRIDQAVPEDVERLHRYLQSKFPGKKVFHARYYSPGLQEWRFWRHYPEEARFLDPAGKKAGVFAGVAFPASVCRTLEQMGVAVTGSLFLPDHEPVTPEELINFSRQCEEKGAQLLVTTEKDAVKFSFLPPEILPLYVLPVDLILDEGEEEFYKWLQKTVKGV